MSETVEIKINLSSNHWDERYPGTRVYINKNLIFESLINEPTEVSWSGELDDDNHSIVIEMYNKQDDDTVLDENDNILNDVVLNIDNISIDEIKLEQLMWTKSQYYPQSEHAPESVNQCVNLGWNGQWKLEFTVPTYLWFLENL